MRRIRFLMVGGFLGAGKTTAIARLARHYIASGKRVGLVTNDQAHHLVDTQLLRAEGFSVGEVAGACFCCKFNDLVDTVSQLSASSQPDVIIAEPVGSCTDLVATVVEPLRQLYGERYELGPFVVLLKPEHGERILGDETAAGFSPKAAYIFLKQIEEADVVAINKIDKLAPDERERLIELVRRRFPGREVLTVSARHGEGFDRFIDVLDQVEPVRRTALEIDYDIYAEGEAELGWLNCTIHIARPPEEPVPLDVQEPDGGRFLLDEMLLDFVERMRRTLADHAAETAHLKVFASSGDDVAIANLVSSSAEVELSRRSFARVMEAELNINARVAIDPELLTRLVEEEAIALVRHQGLVHTIGKTQSFRPARPVPTHRMTSARR